MGSGTGPVGTTGAIRGSGDENERVTLKMITANSVAPPTRIQRRRRREVSPKSRSSSQGIDSNTSWSEVLGSRLSQCGATAARISSAVGRSRERKHRVAVMAHNSTPQKPLQHRQ